MDGDGESQKRSGNYILNRKRGGREELTSILSGMKKVSWVGFTANEEERVRESEHKSLEIKQF